MADKDANGRQDCQLSTKSVKQNLSGMQGKCFVSWALLQLVLVYSAGCYHFRVPPKAPCPQGGKMIKVAPSPPRMCHQGTIPPIEPTLATWNQ